jgi:prolyl-tRNA synthetase
VEKAVHAALDQCQEALFRQAKAYLTSHIMSVSTVEKLVYAIAERRGFVRVAWCGEEACEQVLRRDSGASPRLITEEPAEGSCPVCRARARDVVYYARAY